MQEDKHTYNSLATWRCGGKFKSVIFKFILQIDILSIGNRWVPWKPIEGKWTLHGSLCHTFRFYVWQTDVPAFFHEDS